MKTKLKVGEKVRVRDGADIQYRRGVVTDLWRAAISDTGMMYVKFDNAFGDVAISCLDLVSDEN